MILPNADAPLVHGGDLDAARRLFPNAPEPFLDLSTGINPNPYPIPALPPELFAQLPQPAALSRLMGCAATAYAAPSEENVVAASGAQVLVSLLAQALPPGRAVILGPTYAEHARAASLAGHEVETVSKLGTLGGADLAIAVNPNNPDGKVISKKDLLRVAEQQRSHGGLLIVDEAFMDAGRYAESLCPHVGDANIAVLRSFGKFFGLAGLRLSFALAGTGLAAYLRAALGPWPVSGAALTIGTQALSDNAWVEQMRDGLAKDSRRLDALLESARLARVGGTPLFTLAAHEKASQVFDRLGRAGIIVRRFAEEPTWLRFGLPGAEADWQRLETALLARK